MSTWKTIQPQWQPATFILLNLISWALLLSWLWPNMRTFWVAIDYPIYNFLNNSLGNFTYWDMWWAILNTRVADIFAAFIMLVILLRPNYIFEASQRYRALFTFITLLVLLLIIRLLLTKAIEYYSLEHPSPSLLAAQHYSLQEAFSNMEKLLKIKDRSSSSFPGDHASVLLLWFIFLGIFTSLKQRSVILFITIFFILPRLIAGAHWFSDTIVGGGFVALQTLAWGYYSPMANKLYLLTTVVHQRLATFMTQNFSQRMFKKSN